MLTATALKRPFQVRRLASADVCDLYLAKKTGKNYFTLGGRHIEFPDNSSF